MRLHPVLVVLVAFVALVAGAAWFWVSGSPARLATRVAASPETTDTTPAAATASSTRALDVPASSADASRSEARPVEAVATVETHAPTALVGRFVDQDAQPIAGVVLDNGDEERTPPPSDAEGRFRIEFDPVLADAARPVELEARAPRHVVARREFVLERGVVKDVGDWRLELGCTLVGRVLDVDGRAVAGARVMTTRAEPVEREWARRSDIWSTEVVSRSEARGEFRLDGVPAGNVRTWAEKSGYMNAIGEPLELRPGDERRDLELVLEPEAPEDAIDITVLEPDGTPSPRAVVAFEYESSRRSGSGSNTCDDQGRLHFRFSVRCTHTFRANDAEGRFGVTPSARVTPGDPPILLQLTEKRELALEVVDGHEKPIASFRVELIDSTDDSGDRVGESAIPATETPGRVTLAVPPVRFSIGVHATGYTDAVLGPFEPQNAPAALRATLERLPGLSGRVLEGGSPVAGARVLAGRAIDADTAMIVNGFPAGRTFERGTETVTASDGAFTLYPSERGSIWVRAERSAHAPAMVGPIEFDPAVGHEGVEVVLGVGGTIDGRLRLPAGEAVAGAIVGASCGDGLAGTTRVDGDGKFRFEHLAPGPWLVKRCDSEISPNSTSTTTQHVDQPVEPPSNCVVREGEVTYLELDLRVDPRPRVRGRLRFGGAPASGWSVSAATYSEVFDAPVVVELDAEGRFDARAASPGRGALRFRGASDGEGWRVLLANVEWNAGETAWDRDLPAGSVEFTRGTAAGADATYRLRWNAPNERLTYDAGFTFAPGGTRTFDALPAGTWKITRWEGEAQHDEATFEVTPGGTAKVELP